MQAHTDLYTCIQIHINKHAHISTTQQPPTTKQTQTQTKTHNNKYTQFKPHNNNSKPTKLNQQLQTDTNKQLIQTKHKRINTHKN